MPSTIDANSLAAAVGVGVENVQFVPLAETLPRKILLVGEGDPALVDVNYETEKLYLVTSAEDVGARFGFGFELYRLAKWAFMGSQGVETWVIATPEDEPNGTPSEADGNIQITASGVLAGTLHMYISGEYVPVGVADNDDATEIEASIVAAINAINTLHVTASTTTPVPGAANITAKNKSTYGNYVKITFNEGYGEEFPTGVSAVVTQPTGGTGGYSFTLHVASVLGENDEQNEKYFTDMVLSDSQQSTPFLNAISNWNGAGNTFVGNYSKLVQRPLRVLFGDTAAGSSGLSTLIGFGNSRKTDRTNGIIAVPGSPNHPQEIAALTMGIMARINNNNAAESYVNQVLPGVWPGVSADRWTSSHSSRDQAVKAGISPTIQEDGAVKIQNVVTFYHPDNVPSSSNGYRSMRAISVLQNVTNSVKINFAQEKWQRVSIVEDVTKVTNIIASRKVKDKRAVENELIALAQAWEAIGWIYSASFTISRISTGQYVSIRSGGTGFDISTPIVLSGESWITDMVIQFDTALTVFTQ
jgi:phage tail sheath gpL-like